MVSLKSVACLLAFAYQLSALPTKDKSKNHTPAQKPVPKEEYAVSLGPRPYYILQNMTDSPLRKKLESCANGPFSITGFTTGHRGGGTLQFPEETVESTEAGARMGSGILECDVAFTKDRGLVCRHSFCDLHTTTNILTRPELAAKCTQPFTPANDTADASALCCTSDISTDEFTSLCSKQEGFNASALTPEDSLDGTPPWRTDLYSTCGTVLTLSSYIELVNSLPGYRNFTPELKTPPEQVPMPFNGYVQEQYARDMIDTFIKHDIAPERVWVQSFNPPDIYQWIAEYPQFGNHAIFLDESGDGPANFTADVARLADLKTKGVNILSPPFGYLLDIGGPNNDTIVPSSYVRVAKEAGLDLFPYTFERSPPLYKGAAGDYYYERIAPAINFDGQLFEVLDMLVQDAGIISIFTDWAATVTYYANCFGLTGPDAGKYA